jgi:hypothetical protein
VDGGLRKGREGKGREGKGREASACDIGIFLRLKLITSLVKKIILRTAFSRFQLF